MPVDKRLSSTAPSTGQAAGGDLLTTYFEWFSSMPTDPARKAVVASDIAKVPEAEVAGGEEKPRRSRRPSGSGFDRLPGRRPMKEYPLTKREMWTLGGMQAGSALTLGLSGTCFGFWLNLKQTKDFATNIPPQVVGYWEGLATAALIGSILLAIIGVGLFLISGWNVVSVIRETRHGEK